MAIKWTDEVEREALRLRGEGKTYREIAEVLGCSSALVTSHIGETAMRRRANRRDKTERFAVGDRVVYHPNTYGNADIDGWVGTIIYIDHTDIPYTVRFDVAWCGGMSEERVAARDSTSMRCWYCREENLEAVGDGRDVKKKDARDEPCAEGDGMSKFHWTPELEAELLRLKGEKKSNAEIAYALGISISQVKNRLIYIKQREQRQALTPPTNGVSEDEATGELGELESVMAETIRELTAERDNLAEWLEVSDHDYGELLAKNENCLSKIAEQAQTIEQLQHELTDTQEALSRTEIQLDEARRETAAHLAKVGEQIKVISSLEKRVSELEGELEGANEDVITMQETIALRNEDIDELTERLDRAARRAGELLTQVLMMGE
jgi:DNA-binding CsgD family transcriptional regulator/uncharacterized coiled-coil protein SlyX